MWKVLTEFRLALAFPSLLALLPTLAQQSESIRDAGLDVLGVDGPKPKDVLAVAVGDGAAWILTKDRLARMDAITVCLVGDAGATGEDLELGFFKRYPCGSIALGYRQGQQHNNTQGVHRIIELI